MATTSDDELDYLFPGFDPTSLTVPKLRSIFVSHDIPYSASAKKSQLVDIFNQKLAPRAKRILSAREKIRRTSTGIESVPSSQSTSATGEDDDSVPSLPEPIPEPRARRSRSTRASTTETLEEPTPRAVNGRRRTTRTPVGRDTPATEPDTVRPTARTSRKSIAPPVVKVEGDTSRPLAANESPFSNDNPFQSGSSPLAHTERKRKSTSRRSDEAVRQSTSRRRKTDESTRIKVEGEGDGYGVTTTSSTYDVPVRSLTKSRKTVKKEEPADNTIEAGEEFTEEEQQALIREGVVRGEVDILSRRRYGSIGKKSSGALRIAPIAILSTFLAAYAVWWRKEKMEVGYCNVGKPPTTLKDMQVPDWLDILQPQCEPCPLHAYCYPLSLGGLIPFTPTCEADGEKARKVKAVADRAVEELRERRAKFECGELTEDGKQVKTVEIAEPSLKAEVSSKRRRGMTDEEFEDLWVGAVGEITAREEVTSDQKG